MTVALLPDDLEPIVAQVGDVRHHGLVLDFDGTLSEIVEDPDDAVLAPGARDAIGELTDLTDVAVLSGRPLTELEPRFAGLDVILLGGHGTEILTRDGDLVALVEESTAAPTLDAVQEQLTALLDGEAGWTLERKPASLAVHHRHASRPSRIRLMPRVRELLEASKDEFPGWEVLDGKSVLELCPRDIDKGAAIEWLAPRVPERDLLVIGDDVTDEHAFEAATALGGFAVMVSPRPRMTAARWRLDDPGRVVRLLELLARGEWRQHDLGPDAPFKPIGSYGMIGDSRTAALVGADGSIDWMCAPRFDSPSLFAALLDPLRGGRWRIAPAGVSEYAVQRTYMGDTNVLVTRFAHDGDPVLTLTDFLVFSRVNAYDASHTGHLLQRRLEAFEDVTVEIEFQPRFDYARQDTDITTVPGGLRARGGDEHADLLADGLELTVEPHDDERGDVARGKIRLAAGEVRWMSLRTRGSQASPHEHLSGDDLLDLTVRTWGRWARMIDYDGPWRDEVIRSALVLKGLVYEPTGALVAAPTTSLPEELGGERNWDYRYAWIRDSVYVLECFLRIGHDREAETFIRWLSELTEQIGGAHSLKPLYRVTGTDDLEESTLDHLEGYQGSAPVRIGNGAAGQLQLDIYGAAVQLTYLTEQVGGEMPFKQWNVILELVRTVIDRWDEPDRGLWEIRSELRHHTFSKFQCWLAIDRAIRIGRDLGLPAPYERWRWVADQIRDTILTRGFDEDRQAFTQAFDSPELDASLLLMPLRGLLPPTDPRVRSTVAAVREDLEIADGLLLRYRTGDGLTGHEGAFVLCSFWLVELLARMGELDEAVRLFQRLRGLAGPLGLYAEELDPETHQHLGNFPQGFTHMGLIMAATAIAEELEANDLDLEDFTDLGDELLR